MTTSFSGLDLRALSAWYLFPSGAPADLFKPVDAPAIEAPPFYNGWCRCGHGLTWHDRSGVGGCQYVKAGGEKCDCETVAPVMYTPCGGVFIPGWDYRNNKRAY